MDDEFDGDVQVIKPEENPDLEARIEANYNGKPIYVISLDDEFDDDVQVIKPEENPDLEARIEALEKEVHKGSKSENKDEKKSGPAEIRTQDLCCVEASFDKLSLINPLNSVVTPTLSQKLDLPENRSCNSFTLNE